MPIKFDTILNKVRTGEQPISQDEILVLFEGDSPVMPVGTTLLKAEADSATTMIAETGSVKVNSPSSQTANKKAVKLNTSGYIEVRPIAGQVFLPGDRLFVTLYNQASGNRMLGFRLGAINGADQIGDGEMTSGHKNKTISLLLTAADITTDNCLKLYRYSSDAWFVAIEVKRNSK